MIDYIEERINQLHTIYRSNINRFCITFLNAMEGMGKRTTIKGFLDKIGCADFVKIVPYGSTYPLGEFASALNKFEQEIGQNIGEDLNQSKKRENIKSRFLRLLNTRQRLIVIFENFNHFDIETAFFILELAKSFINMNAGKTILFLISHDEIISYDLRNGIKNLGRYTNYLLFPDWAEQDLTDLFNDIYPNSKISQEYLDQIIQCSFKNAGVFLNNVEYLKERGYIYLEKQFLVCRRFPQDILFGNYREVIQLRYDHLESPLKDALEKASIVGAHFDVITVQNAFHLKMAAQLMKEIEQISRLIFQIDMGRFDFGFINAQAHELIESYIPKEKKDDWNTVLALYYENQLLSSAYRLSDAKFCEYSMLAAYCYENTMQADKALQLYLKIIPALMIQDFYRKALEIIQRSQKLLLCLGNASERLRVQLFYWEYQCNFALFDMKRALNALRNYRQCIGLTGIEAIWADYSESVILYDANCTNFAYQKIRHCYDLLQNMDVSSRNVLRLRIQVTTLLCSIEETLLIDSCQAHFNEAATLARTHQFSDLYYSLLRLSGIAYSGDICIKLLKTAAKYFSTRNKIEYAMCLHNLATEQLFSQNPHNSVKNLSKAYDIFYECGHNGIVCVRNGLSMYYALHTQQYEKALSYIDNFATDYDEDFLLLVLYYNITTILRKLGRNREAREYLKRTVSINKKKGNKLPYFMKFIYAQEGYFALEKNDLERAWCCFDAFFHHDYPDRTEYQLSAAITLAELSERMGRPLPADIQQAAATQNQLAKRLAQEKIIFCEILFWE